MSKSPSYYRARIAAIEGFLKSKPTDQEAVLLRNGVIPQSLLTTHNYKSEESVVTGMLNTYSYSDKPLNFTELTRYNTWFVMHPEKVAGTEIVTTSIQFPLSIKGTKEQIIETISGRSTPIFQTSNNQFEFELELLELELDLIKLENK